MYGQDIVCAISKGTSEIPHKISYPYNERYSLNTKLNFLELLDLRAHKCFWNAPLVLYQTISSHDANQNLIMPLGVPAGNGLNACQ